MSFHVTLKGPEAMIAFGHFLARHLEGGDIFLLSGDLGAGKSTLARGVITTILHNGGIEIDDIPSPTFTLVQSYPWQSEDDEDREVWHIDLWRLEDPEEIIELGFDEALGRHAMFIEWPERLGDGWTHLDAINISISADQPDQRSVNITPPDKSRWHDILAGFDG